MVSASPSAAVSNRTRGAYGGQAKALLGAAASGGDPAGDVQEKRRESTVKELLDFYETHGCFIQRGKHKGKPMKPLTKKYTMGRLRNHVEPLLGHRRASSITSGDIETFVADVTAGKTARDEKVAPRKRLIIRGGEGAARKVVRDLSAVFSFGGRHGFVTKNPVEKASVRKTDNRRERFLTLEEVSHLGEAFDKVETDWTHQAPMYSQPSHFHRRRFFRAGTALGVPGGFGGG
jgi:hypothetical protein